MAYYLGIDAGGTKIRCALADEVHTLATGTGGAGSLLRDGAERVRKSLSEAIRGACSGGGIEEDQITAACLGATGAANAGVASQLRTILASLLPSAKIYVCGDMEIALTAAFGDGPGVVVVSGTGSIAFARNAKGLTARAGGLGPETSDEGSGYWIGKRSLEFLADGTDAPPAALVPRVLNEAARGNAEMQSILSQAGVELAKLAASACEGLFEKGELVEIAITGGVFRNAERVRSSFAREVEKLIPRVSLHAKIVEPTHGALWLARRLHTAAR